MIEKGTYVRIRKTILKPTERADNLPEETKLVPFKMWVKGYLQEESDLFDIVTIKTTTGRIETGRLKVAPHCTETLAALDQYQWDPNPNLMKEKPKHNMASHMGDGLRYALYSFQTAQVSF